MRWSWMLVFAAMTSTAQSANIFVGSVPSGESGATVASLQSAVNVVQAGDAIYLHLNDAFDDVLDFIRSHRAATSAIPEMEYCVDQGDCCPANSSCIDNFVHAGLQWNEWYSLQAGYEASIQIGDDQARSRIVAGTRGSGGVPRRIAS